MNNPTYQERVQAIAEEMAAEEWKHITGNKHFNFYAEKSKEKWINDNLYAARIAVKHITEGIQNFAAVHGACTMGDTEKYLIEQGLIPDSAPVTSKSEPCPHELRCHTRNYPEGSCDCYNMGLIPEQEAGKDESNTARNK